MDQCVKGRMYRIRGRNISIGVYDGEGHFIGIRQKFGSRYLDEEDHWDTGAPHGTVSDHLDLGVDLPEGIEPVTYIENRQNHALFEYLTQFVASHG